MFRRFENNSSEIRTYSIEALNLNRQTTKAPPSPSLSSNHHPSHSLKPSPFPGTFHRQTQIRKKPPSLFDFGDVAVVTTPFRHHYQGFGLIYLHSELWFKKSWATYLCWANHNWALKYRPAIPVPTPPLRCINCVHQKGGKSCQDGVLRSGETGGEAAREMTILGNREDARGSSIGRNVETIFRSVHIFRRVGPVGDGNAQTHTHHYSLHQSIHTKLRTLDLKSVQHSRFLTANCSSSRHHGWGSSLLHQSTAQCSRAHGSR
ncbi:hypothetical protein R6Q59_017718 [Mikania micrantha]